MVNKNEKKVGKIYEFDGETGNIMTTDGTYSFNSKDIYDFNIRKGSEVEFYANKIKVGTEKINIARFITLAEYDINKNNKKESKTI